MTTFDVIAAVDAWEHTHVQVNSVRLPDFTEALNDLGADGWELVSTHSTDPTLGFNSITALMRRRIVPLPAPTELTPGWYADPSGRHEHRLWSGRSWTFRVSDGGKTGRDAPTGLDPISFDQ